MNNCGLVYFVFLSFYEINEFIVMIVSREMEQTSFVDLLLPMCVL